MCVTQIFKKIFIYTGDTKQLMANTFRDSRLIGEIIREGGARKMAGNYRVGVEIEF